LNDLNLYLLYFIEEIPKPLDLDEIIEISDQEKPRDPDWHEAMISTNIAIFEMSYEEFVFLFWASGGLREDQAHQWSKFG
jgi:hypothetical protein